MCGWSVSKCLQGPAECAKFQIKLGRPGRLGLLDILGCWIFGAVGFFGLLGFLGCWIFWAVGFFVASLDCWIFCGIQTSLEHKTVECVRVTSLLLLLLLLLLLRQ